MHMQDKTKKLTHPQLSQPDFEFDTNAIAEKQAKLSLILDKATKDGSAKDFKVIKYREILYEIGNFIQIWDPSMKEPYIGKLIRIVQVDKNIEMMPFVQIQWCLKKKDLLPHILDLVGRHLSNAEIFPSQLKYCLQIPSIKGKCQIFSIVEYGQMTLSYPNYYFSRAKYNDDKKELIPHPSTWKKQCYCGAPENPDLQYVLCEKCEQWFHVECVTQKNLEETYLCKGCERISESSSIF